MPSQNPQGLCFVNILEDRLYCHSAPPYHYSSDIPQLSSVSSEAAATPPRVLRDIPTFTPLSPPPLAPSKSTGTPYINSLNRLALPKNRSAELGSTQNASPRPNPPQPPPDHRFPPCDHPSTTLNLAIPKPFTISLASTTLPIAQSDNPRLRTMDPLPDALHLLVGADLYAQRNDALPFQQPFAV